MLHPRQSQGWEVVGFGGYSVWLWLCETQQQGVASGDRGSNLTSEAYLWPLGLTFGDKSSNSASGAYIRREKLTFGLRGLPSATEASLELKTNIWLLRSICALAGKLDWAGGQRLGISTTLGDGHELESLLDEKKLIKKLG